MKIWFDTEFYENGRTIDLISIGLVREDGASLYRETFAAAQLARKSDWLEQNVLPHLKGGDARTSMEDLRFELIEFAGEKPEFWAYYGAYDWVVLCQLYGAMIKLPKSWPMFVMDVKQLAAMKGNPALPEQTGTPHDAMADALWTEKAWESLQ